jgi:hypothetical protein
MSNKLIKLRSPSEIKCPQLECDYHCERYYMKIHLANAHDIISQQLEIREAKPSEYQGTKREGLGN